jgi:hypothetical protein
MREFAWSGMCEQFSTPHRQDVTEPHIA